MDAPLGQPPVKALVFDLDQEIAALHRLYPETDDKFFFISTQQQQERTNLAFQVHGGKAWEKFKDVPGVQAQVEKAALYSQEKRTSHAAVNRAIPDLRYIVIYTPKWGKSVQDSLFTFDHEIGHQLVPSGMTVNSEEMKGESAADAFACLRCLQRFGRDKGIRIITAKCTERLLHPVHGHVKDDWEHLTSKVLMRIVQDAQSQALEKLSPQETVDAAERYAQEYSLTAEAAKAQWNATVAVSQISPRRATQDLSEKDSIKARIAHGPIERGKKKTGTIGLLFWLGVFCFCVYVMIRFVIAAVENPALLEYL